MRRRTGRSLYTHHHILDAEAVALRLLRVQVAPLVRWSRRIHGRLCGSRREEGARDGLRLGLHVSVTKM